MEEEHGTKFVKKACLIPGREVFVIQFPGQAEVMSSDKNCVFQTDYISEKWIVDSNRPDMAAKVTSVHGELIG